MLARSTHRHVFVHAYKSIQSQYSQTPTGFLFAKTMESLPVDLCFNNWANPTSVNTVQNTPLIYFWTGRGVIHMVAYESQNDACDVISHETARISFETHTFTVGLWNYRCDTALTQDTCLCKCFVLITKGSGMSTNCKRTETNPFVFQLLLRTEQDNFGTEQFPCKEARCCKIKLRGCHVAFVTHVQVKVARKL